MKETTATVLALFTFVAAVYLLAISDTPGIGWRPHEHGRAGHASE